MRKNTIVSFSGGLPSTNLKDEDDSRIFLTQVIYDYLRQGVVSFAADADTCTAAFGPGQGYRLLSCASAGPSLPPRRVRTRKRRAAGSEAES